MAIAPALLLILAASAVFAHPGEQGEVVKVDGVCYEFAHVIDRHDSDSDVGARLFYAWEVVDCPRSATPTPTPTATPAPDPYVQYRPLQRQGRHCTAISHGRTECYNYWETIGYAPYDPR